MPINNRTSFTSHSAGQTITSSSENSQQTAINAAEDVLAKKPWFSIAENAYSGSAAGNGSTDQTAAFASVITDAANETRGGNVLVTPGSHRLTNGGAVSSDGYGLRLLDNVTLWLMPGARVFCDAEGKSPIYANGASNIAIIGMGANTLVDGAGYNVGCIKWVGCTHQRVMNVVCRNGRIGVDLIDPVDYTVMHTRAYADGSIETANTDTRAISVRASSTGTVTNGTMVGVAAEGYSYGVRVMADSGGTLRRLRMLGVDCLNQAGAAGYGISIEGVDRGVTLDGFNIEHPDGLGLQLLGANRCRISNGFINDAGQAGVELFGSSYNVFTAVCAKDSGRLAGWQSFELRANAGVGSTNNAFIGCDDMGSSQSASFTDTVSALSTNNRLIGCSFLETVSLNASSTQTAAR